MSGCKYFIDSIEYNENGAKEWVKDNFVSEVSAEAKQVRPALQVKTLSGINELERENEIKKRKEDSELSEQQSREAELANMSLKFKGMRRNDKNRTELLRNIRVKAKEYSGEDYSFSIKYDGDTAKVFTKTKKGKPILARRYSDFTRTSILDNGKPLFERGAEFQKAFPELIDLEISFDIQNEDDNSTYKPSQFNSALLDIENGIPSVQAERMLDVMEKAFDSGVLEYGNKIMGYGSYPLAQAIEDAKQLRQEEMFKDMSNEEIIAMYENELEALNETDNILNDEYYENRKQELEGNIQQDGQGNPTPSNEGNKEVPISEQANAKNENEGEVGSVKVTKKIIYDNIPISKIEEIMGREGVKDIPISEIVANDNDKSIEDAIRKVKLGLGSRTKEPIYVVKKSDGKYHIMDGHHRVAEAIVRGDKTIKAEVEFQVDLADLLYSEYTKAKENSSNPKLVKSVENAIKQTPNEGEANLSTSKPKQSITKEAFTALTTMLKKAFPKVEFITREQAEKILSEKGIRVNEMRTSEGNVFGFEHQGKIWLDETEINADTPIHEVVGHYGMNIIDAMARGGDEKAKAVMQKGMMLLQAPEGKAVLDEIKANPAYSSLSNREQKLEAIATIIGREGANMFAEGTAKTTFASKVKDFIKSFYDYIRTQVPTLKDKTIKQIVAMDNKEFIRAIIGDAFRGEIVDRGNNKQSDNIRFSNDYENSTQFEKWKGDNRLVSGNEVQDVKTGEPIVVKGYHGTTNEFYEFDSSVKGNIEGHLGKVNYFTTSEDDASQNYLSQGADITGRVENLKERILSDLENEVDESLEENEREDKIREVVSEKYPDFDSSSLDYNMELFEVADRVSSSLLLGGEEQVLDLYIKLNNPIVLGNGSTWFDALEIDETYLEDATKEVADENGISEKEAKDEYDWDIRERAIEMQGEGNKVVDALEKALSDNGYDSSLASEILGDNYYESEVDLDSIEKSLRKAELYDNENGELAGSQVIADLFKNLGFDGIILTDVSERFKNMGLDESTSHIHVFDDFSNQIKLADGTNTTFNPNTNDIRFQVGKNESSLGNEINELFNEGLDKTEIREILLDEGYSEFEVDKELEMMNELSGMPPIEPPIYTASDFEGKSDGEIIDEILNRPIDASVYPSILNLVNEFNKVQQTAKTTSDIEDREIDAQYVTASLTSLRQISLENVLVLKKILGDKWLEKVLTQLENKKYLGNSAQVIGIMNIASTEINQALQNTENAKEAAKLKRLQSRVDNVANIRLREAALTLNMKRLMRQFANGGDIKSVIADTILSPETVALANSIEQALAITPNDSELGKSSGDFKKFKKTGDVAKPSTKVSEKDAKSAISEKASKAGVRVNEDGSRVKKTANELFKDAFNKINNIKGCK